MRFFVFWLVFARFCAFLNVFLLLGRSWSAPGRSWDALGALLGRSWGALGRSWALLGRSGGALGALLDALGTLLGRSEAKIRKKVEGTAKFEVFLGGVLEGFWPS